MMGKKSNKYQQLPRLIIAIIVLYLQMINGNITHSNLTNIMWGSVIIFSFNEVFRKLYHRIDKNQILDFGKNFLLINIIFSLGFCLVSDISFWQLRTINFANYFQVLQIVMLCNVFAIIYLNCKLNIVNECHYYLSQSHEIISQYQYFIPITIIKCKPIKLVVRGEYINLRHTINLIIKYQLLKKIEKLATSILDKYNNLVDFVIYPWETYNEFNLNLN